MKYPNRKRRKLIQATAAASVYPFLIPKYAHARRKTLRILQWNHFVPQYDDWFNGVYVRRWGEQNDTDVIVDNVGLSSLKGRADAEIAAGKGHDIVMFLRPSPSYEDHVIDHREVYEEARLRAGTPIDLAMKSSFNPKTSKYHGFTTSYVPDPVNYRKDLWDDAGLAPTSWEAIRVGGAKIRRKHGIPTGIGLAAELDSNMALRSILHAFGASEQDEQGNFALKTKATLEAIKFVKALYEETMTDEVFTWDASSNNRLMLAGRGSLTLNAISITRTGETQKIATSDRIALAKAPQGPVRQIGLMHLMDMYMIWKFAKNIDGAKQFLVDFVSQFREAFLASRFYNFPCWPDTVPDLVALIGDDRFANPRDKYSVLSDVSEWTTNLGYPGYANAAIDETFSKWTISKMFAAAAKGKMTPQEALNAASVEIRGIFDKWRSAGKV